MRWPLRSFPTQIIQLFYDDFNLTATEQLEIGLAVGERSRCQDSANKTVLTSYLCVVPGFTTLRKFTYYTIKVFFGSTFMAALTRQGLPVLQPAPCSLFLLMKAKRLQIFLWKREGLSMPLAVALRVCSNCCEAFHNICLEKKLNNPRSCFFLCPSSRKRAKFALCQWHCEAVSTS